MLQRPLDILCKHYLKWLEALLHHLKDKDSRKAAEGARNSDRVGRGRLAACRASTTMAASNCRHMLDWSQKDL
ncbi:UNVERIFIED_CONTAM: hypothetical protein K2H54_042973 [Gekko kuhli]